MSLREKFRQVKRREPLKVYIAEIDDHIYIRQKTVAEQNDFEKKLRKKSKRGLETAMDVVRQWMLIDGCTDERGNPIWGEADIDEIAEYPVAMVDGIIKKIREINEYSEDDIEAMAKNVGETVDGDSSAVSP